MFKPVEKPVQEAEKAIGKTVEHGATVMAAVPSRTEAPAFEGKKDLSRSHNLANDVKVAEKGVDELISRAREIALFEGFSANFGNQSNSFDNAAKGHEAPPVIFPDSSGGADLSPDAAAFLRALPGKLSALHAPEFTANKDTGAALASLGGPPVSKEMVSRLSEQYSARAHVLSLSNDIASTWMTPSYLGAEVGGRFGSTPPVPFVALEMATGAAGMYIPEGNGILVSPNYRGTEADRHELIAHEQLHYAAYLGGGGSVRFIDEGGEKKFVGKISWLDEGLTELHSQQLARAHGFNPSYVAYPAEVTVSSYLQQIVGEDALKTAYLTGDFTQVRNAVDAKLGAGTFDQLISKERGADALAFLSGKLEENNVDVSAWNKNPVVARAGVV